MRLNDQKEILFPPEPNKPLRSEIITMNETRTKKGRQVEFAFEGSDKEDKSIGIGSLLIPTFLKISNSANIKVESVNASIVVGQNQNRKELLRLCLSGLNMMVLAFPSGLYMMKVNLGMEMQAPQFKENVLSIPEISFYL
jgi:hypothetical protein